MRQSQRKAEEKKARVSLCLLKMAQVGNELEVEFSLEGMFVTPAGKDINDKTKGHHHLIIDVGRFPRRYGAHG